MRSKAHGHVVNQAFKATNKLRKSENYWTEGEKIGGYRLELPTLRAVVSTLGAMLRKVSLTFVA